LAATSRIDVPVDERIVNTLYDRLPEFRRAYENGGMSVEKLESFGATRRTLRQFLQAMTELETYVRDVLVPDPDGLADSARPTAPRFVAQNTTAIGELRFES
jgi:transaldolase